MRHKNVHTNAKYTLRQSDECVVSYQHHGRRYTEWNALLRLYLHLGMIVQLSEARDCCKNPMHVYLEACMSLLLYSYRRIHENAQNGVCVEKYFFLLKSMPLTLSFINSAKNNETPVQQEFLSSL